MAIANENATHLVDYICERYIPIDYDSKYFYFASPDEKTVGAIQVSTSSTQVAYIPYEISSRSVNNMDEIDAMIKKIMETL
jgi:hypothetical protein